jgi:PmbA protein
MSTNTEILSSTELDLRELAADVVARAMKGGATAADAVVRDGAEFSTVVRMGEIESLKEAGSRGIGLRVFHGKRVASTYSSDFSNEGLGRLVHGALDLAKITSDDPYAGLPDPAELGSLPGDLKLYHEDVYSLPPEQRIEYARRAEKASFEADPRIKNSEGGAFDASTGRKVLANSLGFVGDYQLSYCSILSAPIAQDENGAMQRDFWYSATRSLARLESPESVGREATRRTVRRLGARKVPSTKVPIVFDRTVAASVLGTIFDAACGDLS